MNSGFQRSRKTTSHDSIDDIIAVDKSIHSKCKRVTQTRDGYAHWFHTRSGGRLFCQFLSVSVMSRPSRYSFATVKSSCQISTETVLLAFQAHSSGTASRNISPRLVINFWCSGVTSTKFLLAHHQIGATPQGDRGSATKVLLSQSLCSATNSHRRYRQTDNTVYGNIDARLHHIN